MTKGPRRTHSLGEIDGGGGELEGVEVLGDLEGVKVNRTSVLLGRYQNQFVQDTFSMFGQDKNKELSTSLTCLSLTLPSYSAACT